ncbi:hypothetical protein [Lysobacter gummosus]|uniref:hypothetical protein n=1 Tax=Lysobacter gummosus TaxID=262324 RepID=UPI00363C462B
MFQPQMGQLVRYCGGIAFDHPMSLTRADVDSISPWRDKRSGSGSVVVAGALVRGRFGSSRAPWAPGGAPDLESAGVC